MFGFVRPGPLHRSPIEINVTQNLAELQRMDTRN